MKNKRDKNENIVIQTKKEINEAIANNNIELLFRRAYSRDLSVRYIFMNILISHTDLDLSLIYEDNLSSAFVNYDDDGNIIEVMPYRNVKVLADKLLRKRKDIDSYQKVISFIINTYFEKPEDFAMAIK